MDEQLRVGDAEREQAAAALGEHVVQGRLTAEEHAERLDQVWAARTRADLAAVFDDLPATDSSQPRRTPATASGGVARRGPCGAFGRVGFVPFPVAILALVLVIVATPLTPPVAALIVIGLLVLGPRRRWMGRR